MSRRAFETRQKGIGGKEERRTGTDARGNRSIENTTDCWDPIEMKGEAEDQK